MLLKVDGLSTDQMLGLVRFVGSNENTITIEEVRKMPGMKDDPPTEISRTNLRPTNRRHPTCQRECIPYLVRIVSMKGNLVNGNDGREEDRYDFVLEIPQFLFVFCVKERAEGVPPPSTIAIPSRIMEGVQEVLANISPLRVNETA